MIIRSQGCGYRIQTTTSQTTLLTNRKHLCMRYGWKANDEASQISNARPENSVNLSVVQHIHECGFLYILYETSSSPSSSATNLQQDEH